MLELNKLPKGDGSLSILNTLCLVWRHAKWYVALETPTKGVMFPLNGYKKTEVKFYKDNWGYPCYYKTFRSKDAALKAMKKYIDS